MKSLLESAGDIVSEYEKSHIAGLTDILIVMIAVSPVIFHFLLEDFCYAAYSLWLIFLMIFD